MDFLDRLQHLMKMYGDSKLKLSKDSGIPYTTIERLFNNGWENARISTIRKICDYYGVSLDYMVCGDQRIMPEGLAFAAKYGSMSPYGQALIDLIMENENKYGNAIRTANKRENERLETLQRYRECVFDEEDAKK